VELGAVLGGEGQVGEHVRLGFVHQRGELRDLWAELVGDTTPLLPGRSGVVPRAKAVATKAETTRRPLLPAWARALRMKWTRGAVEKPADC
jgi:hypothetical protein